MGQMEKPTRTHVYQNHHVDSTRWDAITPRADDIVIATPSKAGTTWTQTIVGYLLFPDEQFPEPILQMSQWVEQALSPTDAMAKRVEAQTHRRFLKSHLALDGIPYRDDTKYIIVCRDGRDICMSLWNHVANYSDMFLGLVRDRGDKLGAPYPPAPDDINAFWRNWCTKGWFDWQNDGWPHWSELHLIQSWWEYRHLPNIHLVHYANMLMDTPAAIRELAEYLEIAVDDQRVSEIAKIVSFDNMKANSQKFAPAEGRAWKGGGSTFFHKGTNGRWREEISPENLALYDQAADRVLSPDCRHWIENGGPLP